MADFWNLSGCCVQRSAVSQVQDDVVHTVELLASSRKVENPLADLSVLLLNYNPTNPYNTYYKTGRRIGNGCFGSVYYTKSLISGQERCVKIIKKSTIDLADAETEIETLVLLDHPNIVKFYQYFETNSSLYLVMDVCDGGDFSLLFKSPCDKEWPGLFRDILLGISYCHIRGVVHRDIKYGNCMLCKGSVRRIGRVVDFGLSIIRKKDDVEDEWIADNVGSALFSAPEVFIAEAKYNNKCDLWSVGVMLYCLLTNEHPFVHHLENVPRIEFYKKVLTGPYRVEPLKRAGASQDVRTFLSHLLVKDQKERIDAQTALDKEAWLQLATARQNARRATFSVCGTPRQTSLTASHLESYDKAFQFDKVVMMLVAHITKSADVEDLRLAFAALDTHGHGYLSKDDIKKGLLNFETRISDGEALLGAVERHPDHMVKYDEFLSALMSPHDIEREESVRELFHYFDSNGSGRVYYSEIVKVVGPEEADRVMWSSPRKHGSPEKIEETYFNWEDFKLLMHQVALNRDSEEAAPVFLTPENEEQPSLLSRLWG